jgi:hypothetical protein
LIGEFGGGRLEVDHHLVHGFQFIASIPAYSVIQHPKWDVLFGDCLEFNVQDRVLEPEQNYGIYSNWVEGKFGWLVFNVSFIDLLGDWLQLS